MADNRGNDECGHFENPSNASATATLATYVKDCTLSNHNGILKGQDSQPWNSANPAKRSQILCEEL